MGSCRNLDYSVARVASNEPMTWPSSEVDCSILSKTDCAILWPYHHGLRRFGQRRLENFSLMPAEETGDVPFQNLRRASAFVKLTFESSMACCCTVGFALTSPRGKTAVMTCGDQRRFCDTGSSTKPTIDPQLGQIMSYSSQQCGATTRSAVERENTKERQVRLKKVGARPPGAGVGVAWKEEPRDPSRCAVARRKTVTKERRTRGNKNRWFLFFAPSFRYQWAVTGGWKGGSVASPLVELELEEDQGQCASSASV